MYYKDIEKSFYAWILAEYKYSLNWNLEKQIKKIMKGNNHAKRMEKKKRP